MKVEELIRKCTGERTFDQERFAGLIVEECIRIVEMGGAADHIREHFGITVASEIKVGSRVRVVAGFNVGASGVVNYITPTGVMWVRRDRAGSDVFYHRDELVVA